MSSGSSFAEMCRAELQLCGVEEGTTVAVLSQGRQRMQYVDTFLQASEDLGATAYNVRLGQESTSLDGEVGVWEVGDTPLAGNQPAIEALKGADLVIDTIFLLFSKEQLEIQASGTRILLCIEPIEHLRDMFPTPALRERVEYGEHLLQRASELRFTNAFGTDVTYQLGAYPVITQYGYTDTPGRWDHWPSGFLFTGGKDDGVNGKVVLAPGDIVFPFKDYVRTPVELTIEDGLIQDISGEFDADLLRDYMAGFDDEKANPPPHIGPGMPESASWGSLRRTGAESACRPFLPRERPLLDGPNGELGEPTDTLRHVDIPMCNCSPYLDDQPIVVDGDIVVDEMKSRTPSKA